MEPSPHSILLGAVADDFTGAGDAASFINLHGVNTLLIGGVPEDDLVVAPDVQAIVIALKSRSTPPEAAAADSVAALDWLRKRNPKNLYFKYCSTFDSTPRGNIGPVIDAVLERYDLPYTVLCPSLLVNKRAVRDGVLYVDGVPLGESHMKNHPLNPMWDSDLVRLMAPQGKYPCHKITHRELDEGKAAIDALIARWKTESEHFYVAVDFYEPAQGPKLVEYFGDLAFLTGGSGLCEEIARSAPGQATATEVQHAPAPRLMLAGSCSAMTQKQVAKYLGSGGAGFEIAPSRLLSGEITGETLWQFYRQHSGDDVLFYSSGSAGIEDKVPEADQDSVSALLEDTSAALAKRAVDAGCRRLIVAGGETSGAVMQALGYQAFRITGNVAPGVPVMCPTENPSLQLVLKSGNFGEEPFFLEVLGGKEGK